ncbi:hypothetical protein [Winogradskyella bathintestinalis]|uniref:Uncharacterized protein n=1 Tax=Winogradskyella bathintestinalis TaxID=3035208 RepID=A0ABT7ZXV2_9FLAO|nr:hypothetical protein [Winogradskyella bathintestinalis]MDN3493830.1 hypothetical protein [Winogradskyella bathintestinalis]
MKLLYTLVFVFLTTIVYGQKTTLFQNTNVRAKELKHDLTASGDSLIFKCERTIFEVAIFKDDFERIIKVRNNEAVIPVADLPVGKYIVEVLLRDKLIVITLLRNEPFDLLDAAPLITGNSNIISTRPIKKHLVAHFTKPKTKMQSDEENYIEKTNQLVLSKKDAFTEEYNTSTTDLAVAGKRATAARGTSIRANSSQSTLAKGSISKPNKKYWVVYKINNGQSSEKIQRMSDQEAVDRLIKKNEIDLTTKTGRLNELIVWAIYDSSMFVQHKRKHKTDYMNIASESFQLKPYYKKVNSVETN